jgi:AraC-like DNA-binding protein
MTPEISPGDVEHCVIAPNEWFQAVGDPHCPISFTRGGTVTVATGWGTPVRRMVEHRLYFVIEHAFEIEFDGQRVRISAGDFLWVMPQVPHALALPKRSMSCTFHWLRVRIAVPSRQAEVQPASTPIVLKDSWHLRPAFELLDEEWNQQLEYREQRLRSLLLVICIQAMRAHAVGGPAGPVLTAAQRQRLKELAATHTVRRLSPALLAREMRLSHDYFSRVFRRSFGVTPRRWLMQERIRQAALRLCTSVQSVSQIAQVFGYDDVYLFSRQFKDVMGQGPLAYRRRARP